MSVNESNIVDGRWKGRSGGVPYLVLPDGCVDVIAQSDGLRVVGPMTRARWVFFPSDPPRGVRFRPAAVRAWLGVSPEELVDAVVDTREFSELRGIEDLASVVARARRANLASAPVRALAGLLEKYPGTTIGPVGRRWGLSERHLRRIFAVEVGLSPKRFARIQRLQALVRAFRVEGRFSSGARMSSLAECAFTAGYADQAHMSREVRRLTGQSPVSLRQALADSFKTYTGP